MGGQGINIARMRISRLKRRVMVRNLLTRLPPESSLVYAGIRDPSQAPASIGAGIAFSKTFVLNRSIARPTRKPSRGKVGLSVAQCASVYGNTAWVAWLPCGTETMAVGFNPDG